MRLVPALSDDVHIADVTPTIVDRVVGCLKGIAIGDAIGKQTETLSREDVRRWYPQGVRGFEGPTGTVIPRYVGNSKSEWRFGETTDDTERTLAVARAIIADRRVSHVTVGREMLGCRKGVHPGVPSLWEFHRAGDPTRMATAHEGCGAAIRVAPVGILHASASLNELVNGAREASISTHGGSLAIAAAAATTAAVSAAIDGAASHEVLEFAERAAAHAERQWPGNLPDTFASAVRTVHDDLARTPVLRAADVANCCFPDRPLTIVPLALGLATLMRSAEDAILLAANVGGDSDSVASIAGGILGAMYPDTVNQHWYDVVESVNHHDLVTIASELSKLRY
ncbi:MAG: ADP-ribosylglycohydrolase family protein [Vicinamibacterales bacterium]